MPTATELAADLRQAFALLTRLPAGSAGPTSPRCVWAFPVVGMMVGGLGGGAFRLAAMLGLPSGLAAVWALAGLLLATGALHEDGLADTADGLGGGVTVERKLAIMRDSRIGSYGALALAVSVLLRVGALAALPAGAALGALIAAGAMARTAMLAPLLLPPARADGMGAGLGRPGPASAAVAIGLALLAGALLLPVDTALVAAATAAACGALVAWIVRRQLGGYTGDTLGATEQLAECAVLSALVAMR